MRLIDELVQRRASYGDVIGKLKQEPDPQYLQFSLKIGAPIPVHTSIYIEAQSFEAFHESASAFLQELRRYCVGEWIEDRWSLELKMPASSRPIYLITVEAEDTQNIVYVGQTSGQSGRFVGGHAAITKLHDPIYNDRKKCIYMCGLQVRIDEDAWVDIEFLPLDLARSYLSRVESQLILELDCALNGSETKDQNARQFIILHDNAQRLTQLDGKLFDVCGLQDLPSPTLQKNGI